MIIARQISNLELIKATITYPKIYKHVIDDFSPKSECFTPDEKMLYVGIFDDDDYQGLFGFTRCNGITYEVHTCLLPKAHGAKAVECTKACSAWMFENTECKRIITNVPEYNTLAKRLAENSGMEVFGYNPKSYMKNGRFYGQYMLGMSKEV